MSCFSGCLPVGKHRTLPLDSTTAGWLQKDLHLELDHISAVHDYLKQEAGSGTVSRRESVVVQEDVSHTSSFNDDTLDSFDQRDQAPKPSSTFSKAEFPCPAAMANPSTTSSATSTDSSDKLYPYITQHGTGILSLSTQQDGMKHFVMPGVGYIAYAMMNNGPDWLNIRTAVVLGDPICNNGDFTMIATAFLKLHPDAMFLQISASFASVLQSLGLLINSMGGETHMDLATYTFSGYAKRGLRSAIASAVKEGVTVDEVMQAPLSSKAVADSLSTSNNDLSSSSFDQPDGNVQYGSLAEQMAEVDAAWRAHKGSHTGRIWFINRQPVFAPEPGVRKFTARDSTGRLLGYIFFDAVYEAGSVVGYYANVTRMRPDAHPGVLNLLIKEFIDRVRTESQLSAVPKKLSMKRSQRKKLQLQQSNSGAAGTGPAVATTICAPATGTVRFVSLGLSPFYQMDDSMFKYSKRVRGLLKWSMRHGSMYYPFKSLAAAKAKYGAGLHSGKYDDPSVRYEQKYLAHSCNQGKAIVSMFDLGKFLRFYSDPADAIGALVHHKVSVATSQIKNKVHKLREHKKQQHKINSSSSSSCSSSPGGSCIGSDGSAASTTLASSN